ncbi:hypothetical protein HUU40_00165 [candidate division KSB1 bacterium]|nr:hypothetical protein [candidate division KSB1 bacterium]
MKKLTQGKHEMNNQRRKEIAKIISMVEAFQQDFENLKEAVSEAKNQLETVLDEEREYLENMPESLHSSDRYYTAEAAISNMEEAFSEFENLENAFEFDSESVVEKLDTARE